MTSKLRTQKMTSEEKNYLTGHWPPNLGVYRLKSTLNQTQHFNKNRCI